MVAGEADEAGAAEIASLCAEALAVSDATGSGGLAGVASFRGRGCSSLAAGLSPGSEAGAGAEAA
jgi:hypothetical protein